jgi:hypothetical protein
VSAALQLVDDSGVHHEVARLREQVRTLNDALAKMQQELVTTRDAADLFHDKWKAAEASVVRWEREAIQDARVELIWKLWKAIRRGPPSSTPTKMRGKGPQLSDDRKKLILARLREGYDIESFWMAFYGAERNLWQNRQGIWMDTVESICKSGSELEKYRELFRWELAGEMFDGARGIQAYADREWRKLEIRRGKLRPGKGKKFCERCAKIEIPKQEQTGICVACTSDLMPKETTGAE